MRALIVHNLIYVVMDHVILIMVKQKKTVQKIVFQVTHVLIVNMTLQTMVVNAVILHGKNMELTVLS